MAESKENRAEETEKDLTKGETEVSSSVEEAVSANELTNQNSEPAINKSQTSDSENGMSSPDEDSLIKEELNEPTSVENEKSTKTEVQPESITTPELEDLVEVKNTEEPEEVISKAETTQEAPQATDPEEVISEAETTQEAPQATDPEEVISEAEAAEEALQATVPEEVIYEAETAEEAPQATVPEEVTSEAETAEEAPQATVPEEVISEAEVAETATKESKESIEETQETPISEAIVEDKKEKTEQEHEQELKDYSTFTKEQLVDEIESLVKQDSIKQSNRVLKDIQPLFTAMVKKERNEAQKKFVKEGGQEDDFAYQHSALDNRFDASLSVLKDRKTKYYREQESVKQANLDIKNELLEKLRHLVDGEETTTSINVLKELQKEWKEIGMVPHAFVKSLWANYNALIDRFYDNRSIYFELKELDRKKNMVLKEELCEKAESLESVSSLNEAILHLNELHEEYKHIGPVPRADQEILWQRFKTASDKVYSRRKEYIDDIKKELHKNYESKKEIISKVVGFRSFNSDRINEWNTKTKEIIALQKNWEAIGGLPRDKAKEVNREFWGSFKAFFSNKNAFFKTMEGLREENAKKKEELIAKAEELKESLDWEGTALAFKKLQQEWKDIGPVPQKKREEIFGRFKAACDFFFDNRRAKSQTTDSDYQENYEKKVEICQELLVMAKEKSADQEQLSKLIDHWNEIGFVPKKSIKEIQTMFFDALEEYLKKSGLTEDEQEKWRITAKFSNLKSKPNSNSRLNSKENNLRKQISQLESDISLWKNNLEFFASSKTAEKLKHDFEQKIVKAEDQLNHLKDELKIIKQM